LDLPIEYGVHDTFNVIDLSPFVGTNEDEDDLDLRTNPFQGGEDDGRGPSTTFHERKPQERLGQKRLGPTLHEAQPQERLGQERLGPTTRSMTKRLNEDWEKATDGRETYLYMFQEAHQA